MKNDSKIFACFAHAPYIGALDVASIELLIRHGRDGRRSCAPRTSEIVVITFAPTSNIELSRVLSQPPPFFFRRRDLLPTFREFTTQRQNNTRLSYSIVLLVVSPGIYCYYYYHHIWTMGAYLSEPITKKISSDESGENVAFGASSMQGWRISQEVS